MFTVLLVVHTIIILFLIAIILVQRPDSDGLGGLGGGGGNILSGRAAGNMMTRTTAVLAGLFIFSSLVLAVMSGRMSQTSLVDRIPVTPFEEKQTDVNPNAKGAQDAGEAAPQKDTAPKDAVPSVPKPE